MASYEHLPFCPTVFGVAVRVRWADNPVRRTIASLGWMAPLAAGMRVGKAHAVKHPPLLVDEA